MGKLYRRIMTMGMISITALLAWVYCLLEYRDELAYVAATSGVLLVAVYILLIGLADLRYEKEKSLRDYITASVNKGIEALNSKESGANVHDIERILKAMYVQVRKINGTVAAAEDAQKAMIEELRSSLIETINKAVKVSVKYTKTENEALILAITDLSNKLSDIVVAVNDLEENVAGLKNSTEGSIGRGSVEVETKETKEELMEEPDDEYDELESANSSLEMFGGVGLSQDQIDALIDNDSANVKDEQADVIPFPSKPVENEDPNAMLSQDAIEALFASMNAGAVEEANTTEAAGDFGETAVEEHVPEESVSEEVATGEAISDDPNKVLSPDEIAALFASMGN